MLCKALPNKHIKPIHVINISVVFDFSYLINSSPISIEIEMVNCRMKRNKLCVKNIEKFLS